MIIKVKILCVGELTADILVKPVDGLKEHADSLCVDEIALKSGGDAFNCAVNLARLGVPVGFSGIVGVDLFGSFMRSTAGENGIDLRGIKISKRFGTCKSIVLISKDGQRTFLQFRGANDHFSSGDIDPALVDECEFLHVGGAFHLASFDGADCASLLSAAKAKGKTTSMDIAWDHSGRWLELIRGDLPYLDYFLPSIGEAQKISGKEDVAEMAEFFLAKGVKNILIKLGGDGAYFKNARTCLRCGTYDVPAVDTTGAGDAFVAGFLTGLSLKFSTEKCLEFATAAANINITQLGATGAITSFQQVQDFIRSHPVLSIRQEIK